MGACPDLTLRVRCPGGEAVGEVTDAALAVSTLAWALFACESWLAELRNGDRTSLAQYQPIGKHLRIPGLARVL